MLATLGLLFFAFALTNAHGLGGYWNGRPKEEAVEVLNVPCSKGVWNREKLFDRLRKADRLSSPKRWDCGLENAARESWMKNKEETLPFGELRYVDGQFELRLKSSEPQYKYSSKSYLDKIDWSIYGIGIRESTRFGCHFASKDDKSIYWTLYEYAQYYVVCRFAK